MQTLVNLTTVKLPHGVVEITLAVLVFSAVGCSTKSKNEINAVPETLVKTESFGSSAIIPNDKIGYYTERAKLGDPEAAYKLFAHYAIGVGDGKKGQEFFDRAVSLNYPPALYAKAVHLWDADGSDLQQVHSLIKRAIEGGYNDNKGLLQEVELEIKKRSQVLGPEKGP